MKNPRVWMVAGLTAAAVALRVFPYMLKWAGLDAIAVGAAFPWNFSPLAALCLFSGAYLTDRRWAFTVPLGVMLVSDVLIGVVTGQPGYYTLHPGLPFVYGSYALTILLGLALQRHRRSPWAVGGAAFAGAVLFFVVTNFGQWLTDPLYGRSWSELIRCYTLAIPFFRNTLVGDMAYALVLFGGWAFVELRVPSLEPAGAVQRPLRGL